MKLAPNEKASTLRALAASYIDVLMISTLVYVIETFAGTTRLHWMLTIIAFAVVSPLILQVFPRSLGHYVMGIVRHDQFRWTWIPEPGIQEHSNRVLRVLVLLLFYNGHRVFAESVIDYDFFYLAGHRLDIPMSRLFLGAVGTAWAIAAIGFGRLKWWAARFAMALQGLLLVNDIASLELMRDVAGTALRRATERAGGAQMPIESGTIVSIQLCVSAVVLLLIGLVSVVYRDRLRFTGLR